MNRVLVSYGAGEPIPVAGHLKNRKLKKYFNRETAAAVVAMHQLLQDNPIPTTDLPIYYATGLLEFEDYGLREIVSGSTLDGAFSTQAFIEEGLSQVSPLSQFKILQNMPLCFVSIEFGFQGDNAVVYGSAQALLQQGLTAATEQFVLGAGKTRSDGSVSAGFAIATRAQVERYQVPPEPSEAIALFQAGGLCG